MEKIFVFTCLALFLCVSVYGKKAEPDKKPEWAKKDIRDFSDADMERLLDQWEEDEEPLPPDELPEHLRPSPKMDLSGIDMSDPEQLLKISKKGKTLMMFVHTAEGTPRHETEEITKLWQTGLWNSHIQAERYLIGDDRAIFLFKDGAQAWDAKNFIVEQEKCAQVLIENKAYPGRAFIEGGEEFGPQVRESDRKKRKIEL
ncbi:LDLR chaperone boca [Thrips palmi]|uniref:LDLR chaperone boca n=1 Tax=Thrips palmi TaxID=161013 RepID=A0A6P8ZV98_THRPL|nr:LDLR chaperone boca [Thrips palmi]